MASKSIFAAVFVLLVHVFTSSRRAVCQLEHLRIQIYTIYTFYTAIKEGFATTSNVYSWYNTGIDIVFTNGFVSNVHEFY